MQPVFANGYTGRESPELAFTDPLTGLGNHRRFYDKVDRLISDRADDPAPFAIGILDLDGFKPINDLFGEQGGRRHTGPGRHAAARIDGRPFDGDPHRRGRVRLPLSAGLQRGRRQPTRRAC